MRTLICICATLVLWPMSVMAADPPADIRYDYLDLGVSFGEVDSVINNVDFTSFDMNGSWGFHENFALTMGLGTGEIDVLGDIDTTQLSVGVTPHLALTDRIDLVIPVALEWADFDSGPVSDDDTGYSIGLGIRALPNPSWELSAGVRHVAIFSGSEQSVLGEARWHLNHLFSLALGASLGDDTTAVRFGARFSF